MLSSMNKFDSHFHWKKELNEIENISFPSKFENNYQNPFLSIIKLDDKDFHLFNDKQVGINNIYQKKMKKLLRDDDYETDEEDIFKAKNSLLASHVKLKLNCFNNNFQLETSQKGYISFK